MKKATILAAVFAVASIAHAGGFLSKSYEFKANKPLQVGIDLGDGVKFESIEFVLPASQGDGPTPLFEQPKAKVTISNVGSASVKVGIAIAVVDGEGSLVGAGTGGTKLIPLRAGRQMVYSIGFDDVRERLATGSAFRVSFETTR